MIGQHVRTQSLELLGPIAKIVQHFLVSGGLDLLLEDAELSLDALDEHLINGT
jgi:hypothetical protein